MQKKLCPHSSSGSQAEARCADVSSKRKRYHARVAASQRSSEHDEEPATIYHAGHTQHTPTAAVLLVAMAWGRHAGHPARRENTFSSTHFVPLGSRSIDWFVNIRAWLCRLLLLLDRKIETLLARMWFSYLVPVPHSFVLATHPPSTFICSFMLVGTTTNAIISWRHTHRP